MAMSSIADLRNHLASQIMWPFTACFREPQNINSILPNELLVRIFNHVDELSRSKQKPGSKTSLALPMRLTCRKWNKLLSDKKNQHQLTLFRIPIGVMRIAQFVESYGIFMIDRTDYEFITRIIDGKDYYWGSEMNKEDIPMIRSIEFDESGVAFDKTYKMDSEVWRIFGVRSFKKEHTVAKFTSEFLVKFNALFEQYDPKVLILEHIQLSPAFLLSLTETLERYHRIPHLCVGWNKVNIDTDVTEEDVQRLFMNTINLTDNHPWCSTKEFIENILASWTENDLKFNLDREARPISLTNFEKVTYVWGLKTTLDELFEAIENRVKISNELEWHANVDCNIHYANKRIRERYPEDIMEANDIVIGVTGQHQITKYKHRVPCNDVDILIELFSNGDDHSSEICVKTVPKQPESQWALMKKRLTDMMPHF